MEPATWVVVVKPCSADGCMEVGSFRSFLAGDGGDGVSRDDFDQWEAFRWGSQPTGQHGTKSFVQTERQQREGDRGVSYCMALLAIRYSGVATSSLHGANEPAELRV